MKQWTMNVLLKSYSDTITHNFFSCQSCILLLQGAWGCTSFVIGWTWSIGTKRSQSPSWQLGSVFTILQLWRYTGVPYQYSTALVTDSDSSISPARRLFPADTITRLEHKKAWWIHLHFYLRVRMCFIWIAVIYFPNLKTCLNIVPLQL
jgi:hypothetical protein